GPCKPSGVVEADRDTRLSGSIGLDPVPQPALPQKKHAGPGRDAHKALVLQARSLLLRGRRHQHGEARVLKADAASLVRHRYIIGAAHRRMRVEMGAVNGAALHHIDPKTVQFKLPAT